MTFCQDFRVFFFIVFVRNGLETVLTVFGSLSLGSGRADNPGYQSAEVKSF